MGGGQGMGGNGDLGPARVRLLMKPHKAMLIREQAVCPVPGGQFAFGMGYFVSVVNDQGVVQDRPVTLGGQADGRLRVVRDGLSADDWVVVSADENLQPGMIVKQAVLK